MTLARARLYLFVFFYVVFLRRWYDRTWVDLIREYK